MKKIKGLKTLLSLCEGVEFILENGIAVSVIFGVIAMCSFEFLCSAWIPLIMILSILFLLILNHYAMIRIKRAIAHQEYLIKRRQRRLPIIIERG